MPSGHASLTNIRFQRSQGCTAFYKTVYFLLKRRRSEPCQGYRALDKTDRQRGKEGYGNEASTVIEWTRREKEFGEREELAAAAVLSHPQNFRWVVCGTCGVREGMEDACLLGLHLRGNAYGGGKPQLFSFLSFSFYYFFSFLPPLFCSLFNSVFLSSLALSLCSGGMHGSSVEPGSPAVSYSWVSRAFTCSCLISTAR